MDLSPRCEEPLTIVDWPVSETQFQIDCQHTRFTIQNLYFLQIFLHSMDALEFKGSYHKVLFIQVNCYLEMFWRKYIYNFYIIWKTNRSCDQRCFIKKGVLKNFSKLTGKHVYRSLFFNKLGTLTQVFFWEFYEHFFYRTPFLQNTSTSRRLPLDQSPAIVLCKKFTNFPTNLVCNKKYKMGSKFILRKAFIYFF